MMLDTEKTFAFVCKKHGRQLVPSGHSVGLGGECWPGISCVVDETTKKLSWTLDTSELGCEGGTKELEALDETSPTYEEDYGRLCDECVDSWEIVQSS